MSVITPNETERVWQPQGREAGVSLYLSGAVGDADELFGARVDGLPITLSLVPVSEWIDPVEISTAAVAVIQVDADSSASVKRFERLAAAATIPVIAAAYEPPLALVRSLLRSGAHDVLPLPLSLSDLQTSIAPLREQVAAAQTAVHAATGRLIAVAKSRGGAGATSVATQLACRFAHFEKRAGRDACLIDFDVQFGDAAFQLGLKPRMTVSDLVEAGARLDGELLRSVAVHHPSGLEVIAAPREMLPLESLSNEQVIAIVERAQREYGSVFVDLPANWTNWSLSLAARADVLLLVTELSVPSLNRARRQIDLLNSQGLGDVELRVVINRFEKKVFGGLKPADVRTALGREAAYTIANDPDVLCEAVDRGIGIEAVKRKSALGRDLDLLDAGLASILNLER
ncbi:CpaE family protein [Sphingomonas sp. GCM10030256]|uniref:AAA family ATPase n=1 Tax=Sphingomonas sp. GCM10030256 TaxID=3273427 RepID=UPI00361FB84C